MTTIDDKAVEAAARAIWLAEPLRANSIRKTAWEDESDATHERYRPLARAALEAADKVRAEGFDFEAEAKRALRCGECELPEGPVECLCQQVVNDMEDCARRAFAAGLAEDEVERTALREALRKCRAYIYIAATHNKSIMAAKMLPEIDAALGERQP